MVTAPEAEYLKGDAAAALRETEVGRVDGADMSANVRHDRSSDRSDLRQVKVLKDGFAVKGSEELNYSFTMVDDIFDTKHEYVRRERARSPDLIAQLADLYRPWKRCLLVTDKIVEKHYGQQARDYFQAKGIELELFAVNGGGPSRRICTR